MSNALEEAGFEDATLEAGLNTTHMTRDYIQKYNELKPNLASKLSFPELTGIFQEMKGTFPESI